MDCFGAEPQVCRMTHRLFVATPTVHFLHVHKLFCVCAHAWSWRGADYKSCLHLSSNLPSSSLACYGTRCFERQTGLYSVWCGLVEIQFERCDVMIGWLKTIN